MKNKGIVLIIDEKCSLKALPSVVIAVKTLDYWVVQNLPQSWEQTLPLALPSLMPANEKSQGFAEGLHSFLAMKL